MADKDQPTELGLPIPGLYMLYGLQGGGKSHMIRYIAYDNRKKFDCVLAFSNTGFVDGNLDFIDPRFVHREYNEAALQKFKNKFEAAIAEGKKPCGLVIFDDCVTGKQWRSPVLTSLITQVRHYNITVVISTQWPKAILPVYRDNAFKVFMFHMSGKLAINALYENHGQMLDTFEMWKKFFIEATSEKYMALVYDPRNGGRTLDERYECITAPRDIPKFTLRHGHSGK